MNELIVEMDKKEFVSTGIEKLDKLLGGGLQRGFTTAISSVPGTNIEVISKQFASTDDPIFITTNETKNEIISTMHEFEWDTDNIIFEDIAQKNLDEIIQGESKRVSVHQQRSRTMIKELIKAGSEGLPPMNRAREDYLAVLSNRLRVDSSKKIIINSLDFFLENYHLHDVLQTLKAGKVNIIRNNGALILFFTRGIHDIIIERQIELLADCVLELDVIKKGSAFDRILSVKKIRNVAKKIGTARYDIDENGFTIEEIDRIL